MARDITTAWNIPLSICFTKAIRLKSMSENIQVELVVFPQSDSLSGQVCVQGLPTGVMVSVVHLHIPPLNMRISHFRRVVESEEIWIAESFLDKIGAYLEPSSTTSVLLQIGLTNPSRTQAVIGQRALMYQLFTHHWQSDWIIRVDQRDIHVHKAIIGAQSPVFRAIIDHQTGSNISTIQDFDYDVVRAMLHFLYTGEIQPKATHDMAYELYRIADKYLIDGLKRISEVELVHQLDRDNVINLLTLASMPSGTSFKQLLIPAVLKLGSDWLSRKGFESFTAKNPSIVREIFQYIYKEYSPKNHEICNYLHEK